eukprot:ANDGO_08438.mRNA.1 hypothetical protein
MDIVSKGPWLSDPEVAIFLRERSTEPSRMMHSTATECSTYLTKTCGIPSTLSMNLLSEFVESMKSKVSDRIDEMDLINLLNIRPRNMVELHVTLTNCDSRFSEAEQDAILEFTSQFLLPT